MKLMKFFQKDAPPALTRTWPQVQKQYVDIPVPVEILEAAKVAEVWMRANNVQALLGIALRHTEVPPKLK